MSDSQVQELMTLALWGTPACSDAAGRVSTGDVRRDWQRVLNEIGHEMEQADQRTRAQLRHRLGYIALILGDVRMKAQEAFTLVLNDARQLGDRTLEAMALNGLSVVADRLGQRHRSLEYAEQAIAIAKELGNQRLLALALNNQAQFCKENGKNTEAHGLFEQVEAIGRELNDESLILGGLIGKGRTASMAKAFVAIDYYEQATAIAKAQGNLLAEMLCYNNLSDWMINTGQYERAIALREESLALARSIGSREGIGRALIGQAKAYTLLGDLDRARELLDQGVPMVLSAGDIEGDLHSSLNNAYLVLSAGDVTRAAQMYRDVLERSLAAPDHACAIFAQRALDLMADGERPTPGIIPTVPVTQELLASGGKGMRYAELGEEELELVVGGLRYTYNTGDMSWVGTP